MSSYPKARVGGSGVEGDFEKPKVKPTPFVIGHVASIGYQPGGQYEPKDSVVLAFELAQTDSQGHRFILFAPYTNSVNEKAKLRAIVDALDPDAIPDDAGPDFDYDLGRLVGRVGFASLKAKHSAKDKDYVVVDTVMELPEGMPTLKPTGNYDSPWGFWKYLDGKGMDDDEAHRIIKEMRARAKANAAKEKASEGMTDEEIDSDTPF